MQKKWKAKVEFLIEASWRRGQDRLSDTDTYGGKVLLTDRLATKLLNESGIQQNIDAGKKITCAHVLL